MSADDYHTDWADRARARSGDPETSREAAEAVTPHLSEIQASVARYAIEAGPQGFTDWELSEHFLDETSTYRTRRAELAEQNILLDTGLRRKNEGSRRNRIVWAHRQFADQPPPIRPPMCKPTSADIDEARKAVPELRAGARQMRKEGRAMWADQLDRFAELLAKLAG